MKQFDARYNRAKGFIRFMNFRKSIGMKFIYLLEFINAIYPSCKEET